MASVADRDFAADEDVFSLMYMSTELVALEESSLNALALEAATTNAMLGITGYLIHRTGRFTQYLEGRRQEVEALFERIRVDQRHSVNTVLSLGQAPRRFPNWSMKLLDPLYFPSGGALDTIDELLTLNVGSTDTDGEIVRSVAVLMARVNVSE